MAMAITCPKPPAGVTTKYLVDTVNPTGYSQVLDELISGAVTRTYAYGLQRINENQLVGATWTPSFYGYDGHGNARFLANASGTMTDTYQFDTFGNQIASTGTTPNPYLYSGERFDSNLNLYHLRARYYNVQTGRFETMDPDSGDISDPATLHRYVYTRNNPVSGIDPTGRADIVEALSLEVKSGLTVKENLIALRFGGQVACVFYDVYFALDSLLGGDPSKKPLVCNLLNLKWPKYPE